MKLTCILLLGLALSFEPATAQNQVVGAQALPAGDPATVIERFYEDLSKNNLLAIRNSVFHDETLIDAASSHVYGRTLVRSPDILGFNQLPRISNVEGIRKGFKSWTGLDVVDYRVLIVRYELSPRMRADKLARGFKPNSKIEPFEEIYCDLWMCGTDGKWRVACDYNPGVDVDCQSLGLALTKDEAKAIQSREQERLDKEKSDDFWINGPAQKK
jgi:hypothetical protein